MRKLLTFHVTVTSTSVALIIFEQVVEFVHHALKDSTGIQTSNGKIMLSPEMRRKKMARIIANEALERGSADNVCVILVWLKKGI